MNEKRAFKLQAEFQKLYGRATSSITAKFKTWLSDTGFEAFENYCQKLQVHFEVCLFSYKDFSRRVLLFDMLVGKADKKEKYVFFHVKLY